MVRRPIGVLAAGLTGVTVVGTSADTLSWRGNYYAVPRLSMADPGMAELAVAAAVLTGIGTVGVAVLSLIGYHPLSTLAGTSFSLAVLARPAYATVPYGDIAFVAACVLGAAAVSVGATFGTIVEGRRYLSRWRRSGDHESAAG